jgi:NAD-dependent deacetylase
MDLIMDVRNAIERVSNKIKKVKTLTLLSGSGISAESGVPTFRGKDGLWKKYRAENLATPRAFYSNHKLVWEWYNWRREIISDKKPNPAHYACVDLEGKFQSNFNIITQNVDGLHQKAGSKNIIELHGSIWRTKCTECGNKEENREKLNNSPKCHICGGLLRPDVVWFGEALDEKVILKAFDTIFASEMVIIIGTSGVVYPAAQFGSTAKDNGSFLVEINLDETPNSSQVDISIKGKAGEILPKIVYKLD